MYLDVLNNIFAPTSLLMMNLGVAAGIIIGALPGLSVVLAVAVLLPLTFGMESIAGMYLLLGTYCGGTYGGSITAILIKTPGTPAGAATVLDGYPMAQKGRAGDALTTALIVSTIGGIFSCLMLMFFAPPLARMALRFGPPEYFSMAVLGLTVIAGISSGSILKGMIVVCVGLFISTIGIDATEGGARFAFGSMNLMGGISPIIAMLGGFAVAEVLNKSRLSFRPQDEACKFSKSTVKLKDILKYWKTLLRSCLIGTFIGAVPGTGAALAAFLGYNEAKRASKHPEEFGTGCLEGVVACETANNAVTGATLIPLLTLGIPGDLCTAVLMGALIMQGITPGPMLFTEGSFWVYSIMGGLLVINIFMLLQGTFFIRAFMNVVKVPFEMLIPVLMILCTLGAFAVFNSKFDVFIMMIFGIFGYILVRFDFPIAPMIIAMVLGPLVENNLRRSMILSKGNFLIFFTRPIAMTFMLISIFTLVFSVIRTNWKAKKKVA